MTNTGSLWLGHLSKENAAIFLIILFSQEFCFALEFSNQNIKSHALVKEAQHTNTNILLF